MNSSELLLDGFSRVTGTVHGVLDDIDPNAITTRLDDQANSIAWLVWHLTRIQDDHLADAFDGKQLWMSQGWVERFALPFSTRATGFAQTSDQVAAVRPTPDLLLGYFDAVADQTDEYLAAVTDADLDRIVDTRWNPPVTLGVRLISVLDDCLEHAGQAAFVRGVLDRR